MYAQCSLAVKQGEDEDDDSWLMERSPMRICCFSLCNGEDIR